MLDTRYGHFSDIILYSFPCSLAELSRFLSNFTLYSIRTACFIKTEAAAGNINVLIEVLFYSSGKGVILSSYSYFIVSGESVGKCINDKTNIHQSIGPIFCFARNMSQDVSPKLLRFQA